MESIKELMTVPVIISFTSVLYHLVRVILALLNSQGPVSFTPYNRSEETKTVFADALTGDSRNSILRGISQKNIV